jgi:type II secretory pathway predicted ATPase ExeA
MQAKLREIKLKLNLDQSTFDKFSPVYIKYEQEIYEIDFGATAEMMKVNPDSLSVDEADKLILSQLQTGRKLINIRENYYKQFRAIITPQQIIKLYHSEAELRKKVINELKRRMISK